MRPISNLVSSGQLHAGDWVLVDFNENEHRLRFTKRAEGLSVKDMAGPLDALTIISAASETRKRRKAAS